jgi:hypothetical protein
VRLSGPRISSAGRGGAVSVLWDHIYGEALGVLGLFSGVRSSPRSKRLEQTRSVYFSWPDERDKARKWVETQARGGREVYHCGHLLTGKRRIKENAAPLSTLYVDGDGAIAPEELPEPTAIVESSPGKEQLYWRLSHPLPPRIGEAFNRRLSYAMRADRSGWDLTQLLRVPGTRNFKYARAPAVKLLAVHGTSYVPEELSRTLPSAAKETRAGASHRAERPQHEGIAPTLDRLSPRMRGLILNGNRGEYQSRSEADMAAALALFGAGYTEGEVWAVLSDPSNGISEKFREKGRHGEHYLSITIAKAQAVAQASPRQGRHRVYARREGVVRRG